MLDAFARTPNGRLLVLPDVTNGSEQTDVFRRAASYVDPILKGTSAGELPVQAPTKYELVINLKTAP